jgi:XRN 5'-3' exonuclease N-terminus
LAVDGLAAFSKLKLQLERRDDNDRPLSLLPKESIPPYYKETPDKSSDGACSSKSREPSRFSTRILTPGNAFMSLLDRQMIRIATDCLLQDSTRRLRATRPAASAAASACGEGDQKILSAIAASRRHYGNKKRRRLILSVDSDIILASIAQGLDGVLCVDPVKLASAYDAVSFSYDGFMKDMEETFKTTCPDLLAQIRVDFVFLVLTAGCDALPAIHQISLEHLWRCYIALHRTLPAFTSGLIDQRHQAVNIGALFSLFKHATETRHTQPFSLEQAPLSSGKQVKAKVSFGQNISRPFDRSGTTCSSLATHDDLIYASLTAAPTSASSTLSRDNIRTILQALLRQLHILRTNETVDFFGTPVTPFSSTTAFLAALQDLLAAGMQQSHLTSVTDDFQVSSNDLFPILSSIFLLGPLRPHYLPPFIGKALLNQPSSAAASLNDNHPLTDIYSRWQYFTRILHALRPSWSLEECQIYGTTMPCFLVSATIDHPFKIAASPVITATSNLASASVASSLSFPPNGKFLPYGLVFVPPPHGATTAVPEMQTAIQAFYVNQVSPWLS